MICSREPVSCGTDRVVPGVPDEVAPVALVFRVDSLAAVAPTLGVPVAPLLADVAPPGEAWI